MAGELKEKAASLGSGSTAFKDWVYGSGRVLYIDRITAQILNVPGGDEMIIDPEYADP